MKSICPSRVYCPLMLGIIVFGYVMDAVGVAGPFYLFPFNIGATATSRQAVPARYSSAVYKYGACALDKLRTAGRKWHIAACVSVVLPFKPKHLIEKISIIRFLQAGGYYELVLWVPASYVSVVASSLTSSACVTNTGGVGCNNRICEV